MTTRRTRRRGFVRQVLDSGLLEAYRLDAAAAIAFVLIGVSVYRLAPDLLWAYAGAVILLAVVAIGKASAGKPVSRTD